MISKSMRTLLARNKMASRGLINTQARAMGGGEKKPAMSADEREFDVVFVGGLNSTALLKFIQQEDAAQNLKMALVTEQGRFVLPEAYYPVSHGHIPPLKLESGTVSSQVDNWSRCDVGSRVTNYDPQNNKVTLNNGREYTYKALVLAPGFETTDTMIEGLPEMREAHESENVFVHQIDNKLTVDKNYYHGWNHRAGNMLNYSPAQPYKGEGSDFYSFIYESFNRQDKQHGLSHDSAKIQFFTPNKNIFSFPYANEVALDECRKRGIDVCLGHELTKVHYNSIGEKIATFRNVDTGATLEHAFTHANITAPSRPWSALQEAGITNADGLIDVNQYTLQHQRFENIFAWGDAINGNTTRTNVAASAQNPVVKNNLLKFMAGQELDGVYDGYTYFPLYMSHSHATGFSHTWDYQPAANNHAFPQYGLFANRYFHYQLKSNLNASIAYTSFKKDHGPPYKHFSQTFDPIEHNQVLQSRNVDVEALRSIHGKKPVAQVEA